MPPHRQNHRPADQVEITREQHALCRRRVAFLLREKEHPGDRPLIDLLANAYHQGLVDAVEGMGRHGWIRPTDAAPAQQDNWP